MSLFLSLCIRHLNNHIREIMNLIMKMCQACFIRLCHLSLSQRLTMSQLSCILNQTPETECLFMSSSAGYIPPCLHAHTSLFIMSSITLTLLTIKIHSVITCHLTTENRFAFSCAARILTQKRHCARCAYVTDRRIRRLHFHSPSV